MNEHQMFFFVFIILLGHEGTGGALRDSELAYVSRQRHRSRETMKDIDCLADVRPNQPSKQTQQR